MASQLWPVCGHDRVIALLAHELASNSLRHAYLISGPPHSGKSTIASAFAQSIICSSRGEPGAACGECDNCRRVAKGIHPDLQLFSLESQRQNAKDRTAGDRLSVETVREICVSAVYRPFSAERRVIIIDDAGSMTGIAQEAMLKTLEEPPTFLVLILLTESADALKPTVRSRCEQLNLLPVSPDIISRCLEDRGAETSTAQLIARQASGLPGWAIATALDPGILKTQQESTGRAAVWVNGSPFQRIARSFELANDFGKQRDRVFSELEAVSMLWRGVMMNSAGAHSPAAETLAADQVDQLAGAFELAESLRAVESVAACMRDLDSNVRPRLALEAMVMQWPTNSLESRR